MRLNSPKLFVKKKILFLFKRKIRQLPLYKCSPNENLPYPTLKEREREVQSVSEII